MNTIQLAILLLGVLYKGSSNYASYRHTCTHARTDTRTDTRTQAHTRTYTNMQPWYTYLFSDRVTALLILPDRQGSHMFLVEDSNKTQHLENCFIGFQDARRNAIFRNTCNLPFTILDPNRTCYSVFPLHLHVTVNTI